MKKTRSFENTACVPSGDTTQEDLFHFIEREKKYSRHGKTRTCDRLVPNQEINQLKSLSWRHLLVFGPFSDRQVWTSTFRVYRELAARSNLLLSGDKLECANAQQERSRVFAVVRASS